MARIAAGLAPTEWAATGDTQTPQAAGLARTTGWTSEYSTPGGSVPTREVFNRLFQELSAAVLDFNTHGMSEWESTVAYAHPAAVLDDDEIYLSKQDSTGQRPSTDSSETYWRQVRLETASAAETQTGRESGKSVTPAGLQSLFAGAGYINYLASQTRYGLTRPVTQSQFDSNSSTQARFPTVRQVRSHVADVRGAPPSSLNTVQKLASALDNDPDVLAGIRSLIAGWNASLASAVARLPEVLYFPTNPLALTTDSAGTAVQLSRDLAPADRLLELVFGVGNSTTAENFEWSSTLLPAARISAARRDWSAVWMQEGKIRIWKPSANTLRLEDFVGGGTGYLYSVRVWK